MSKIRKFGVTKMRKLTGGKDPLKIIKEFMLKRGLDSEGSLQQRTADTVTWSVSLSDDEELEITLEGLTRPPETTLYMGLNVMAVPLRESSNVLHAALTIADTLIGAKLSLVNYDLVLSVTSYAANVSVEDLDYFFELIVRQKPVVQEAIADELGAS